MDPTQHAFWYSEIQEKPVNADNNPAITTPGLSGSFGWHTVMFRVTKEVIRHNFTDGEDASSPYDESLDWDSSEGVTMGANWSLSARVVDPYLFFQSFGDLQYEDAYGKKDMKKHVTDMRIYECLRQLGFQAAVIANEVNARQKADLIQRDPTVMKRAMLEGYSWDAGKKEIVFPEKPEQSGIREYARQFGVEIIDIEFPGRFMYPDGNTIEEGRQLLTAVDTELRSKEIELATAKAQASQNLQASKMEAQKIVAEAQKKANSRRAETDQLAASLAAKIQINGPEGTFRLEMAEMQRRLMEAGVVPEVILTEGSIFASPYYPTKSE